MKLRKQAGFIIYILPIRNYELNSNLRTGISECNFVDSLKFSCFVSVCVELAGIAPASKLFHSKSSTSLVYFIPDESGREHCMVRNKQNPYMPFPELVRMISLKNPITLFS